MSKPSSLKKIGVRFIAATLVFLCIKLTVDNSAGFLSGPTLFYYISALFFFMITWELNDWVIKRHLLNHGFDALNWRSGLKILGLTLLPLLPVFGMVYYLALFHFPDLLGFNAPNAWLEFRADFFRSALIAVTVIIFNLFYFGGKAKEGLEKKITQLQNEAMVSEYQSLKSQITPHFLFNSLNTLTSLMYDDRDLASDFVARLSSCYRYILDHGKENLVGLDKELAFLDAFIFMMDVRHKSSLKIITRIDVDPTGFVIPPMSLQMLVENALKHNYFSQERPLSITIFNTSDRNIVAENTLRKRKLAQKTTKLGLKNIKKRYAFYTKEPVKVIEENGIFSVEMPLLKRKTKQLSHLQITN